MDKTVIGCDIGGTKIRIGKFDGTSISRLISFKISDMSPESLMWELGGYILRNCPEGVCALSLGIAGTLSRDGRCLLKTPNLPAMENAPLAEMLENSLGVPVFLDNDINVLLRADAHLLGLPKRGLLLGVYVGTGLGGAVFLDGAPLPGKNGISEIGHMPIAGRRDLCTCGNRGCAENYVSGRYLQSLRVGSFPETPIERLFTEHAENPALLRFVDELAAVTAGALNLLDPQTLVMGGGVCSMRDFPRESFAKLLYDYAMKPVPADTLDLRWSPGDSSAGVLGAALIAMEKLAR
ncbi:MAG: ROK family protein [Clostridiales bacterium]|nr:ROK family protein [Clostridiales bacterium]